MYSHTVTVSSKGQIVLPKKIRACLGTNVISMKVNENNQIILSPIPLSKSKLNSIAVLSFDQQLISLYNTNC